jgi:hypothetical protein
MTPERAREIIQLGSRWVEYSKHMTDEEKKFVVEKWDTMPGYTCFYDALVRIAKGE